MTVCFEEPTLDELLRDPLIRQVMQADGVDTTALRSMMGVLASEIAARPKPVSPRRLIASGFLRLIASPNARTAVAMPERESCLCGAG